MAADIFRFTYTVIKLGTNSVATVAQVVFDRTDAMDKALRCLAMGMSNALHLLLEKSQLFSLRDEELKIWREVTKYNVKEGTPMIFWEFQSSIKDVLEIRRHQDATIQLAEQDEEKMLRPNG